MAGRFEDHRGVIEDLLGPVDCVTRIFTRASHVRGNHVHAGTTQWAYVASGRLLVASREPGQPAAEHVYGPGMLAADRPGVAHAWKALEDTTVLVFTKGPRSGENYESDTQRLPEDEWLLR